MAEKQTIRKSAFDKKLDQFCKVLEPEELQWIIWKKVNYNQIVPFINNRAVQNRLDDVFGKTGWQNEIKEVDGGFILGISIYVGKEWITKWDGASRTDIEPVKGGISDAMKRASTQWGLGRELYDYPIIKIKSTVNYVTNELKEQLDIIASKQILGEADREYFLDTPTRPDREMTPDKWKKHRSAIEEKLKEGHSIDVIFNKYKAKYKVGQHERNIIAKIALELESSESVAD